MNLPSRVHLDLDSAWPADLGGLPRLDLRTWGPRLRFIARTEEIEVFATEVGKALDAAGTKFVVYGSGDFHHLSALWLRRFLAEPMEVVTFDNHPDWDIRPPRWSCGAWVNRALEASANLQRATVWGLANFEYWWPGRMFAPRSALSAGRLEVHAWRRPGRGLWQARLRGAAMSEEDWKPRFEAFARRLEGKRLYVTIDLDCLVNEDVTTNWEQGRFRIDDLVWALATLRARGVGIVGGDICGAWSEPEYARSFQRFAARMDHPALPPVNAASAQAKNVLAFRRLWPALVGS